jgi:hypothetical protein
MLMETHNAQERLKYGQVHSRTRNLTWYNMALNFEENLRGYHDMKLMMNASALLALYETKSSRFS